MWELRRDGAVFEIARKQHGVVSYAQLAERGVTRARLRQRRSSGEWRRILPSVVRMYWAEDTFLSRAWATWLWAGPLSALSHGTAAQLCGVSGGADDGRVHVTVPWR